MFVDLKMIFWVAIEAYENIRIPEIFNFNLECKEWVDIHMKHGMLKR